MALDDLDGDMDDIYPDHTLYPSAYDLIIESSGCGCRTGKSEG
jgi:hypothetical protein